MSGGLSGSAPVSSSTILCGVIGDPVEHSLSPAMHNAAFRELGLDYVYVAFRVRSEGLGKAIDGMRGLGIRGLNVTIPHKVAVLSLLNKVDEMAGRIGAVNTIVNDGGVLTGYNTDAEGFLLPLSGRDVELRGKTVVVVGAGGAARAICFGLLTQGAELIILNRSADRAAGLAGQLSLGTGVAVKSSALDETGLRVALTRADLLINTTSVGMAPAITETPVPSHLLRPGMIVYDIVYSPAKTRLLREAEQAGARTVGGLEMLAWQGAAAFERWTGRKAPVDVMREAAMAQLGARR